MEFRDLKANEIDVRVSQITEEWLTLLLYKDARVDMDILDETVGSENWQRDHKELKGNIYCGVSIWDKEKNQWITKWDAGKESFSQAEKGEASDSFKRSCFNFRNSEENYIQVHQFGYHEKSISKMRLRLMRAKGNLQQEQIFM